MTGAAMRILVLLSYYAPHWTGLTQYAVRLAEAWSAAGHQVTVLCAQHDASLPMHEHRGGVEVIRLPVSARLSRASLTPGIWSAVVQHIPAHDVIVIHSPYPEIAGMTALTRWYNKPSIVIHHGDVVMPAGWRNRVYQLAMDVTHYYGLRWASHIITHSADYSQHSTWLAPLATRVIAITPPVTLPPPDANAVAALRARLGGADALVIGLAGRFVAEKGFDTLIAQLPALRTALPHLRIAYAGAMTVDYEQFYHTQHAQLAHHTDIFVALGLLRDPQDLADFYAACDAVLLPSRSDCYPSVLPEALICGTPIIVNNIPGARAIVHATGAGMVIDTCDTAALIDTLTHLPPAPDATAMAHHFVPQRRAHEYLAVMHELVNPHAPWLSQTDESLLDQLLANEVDMAYRRRARTLLAYLELTDGLCVLDCGCGMGVYLHLMAQLRQLQLVGVDGDLRRLRQAQPHATVAVEIAQLPFAPATFDRILISEVLEHLDDDIGTLQELYTLLRPGGIVAVSVPCATYPFWWDPINATREWLGMAPITNAGPITGIWSNHVRLYTPDQLRRVAEQAGFVVEQLEPQTRATVPFAHLIVYSIGKPLLDYGILPASWLRYADRRHGTTNDGRWWHPFNLIRRVMRWVDMANDPGIDPHGPAVTIVAKLRKV
jgi:glycosyltransferase involved in cell wall biosynthesis/SAM-dependent methyltransferase